MTAAAVAPPRAPWWRQLIGFNLLTGVLLGIGGWYVGWFGAHAIKGLSIAYFADTDYNELSVYLAYLGGVIGFLVGLGFLNYPLARLRGYPPSLREKETGGWSRYFSLCTDHKVVGIQYLWGIGLFFFIGGLNAMLIRTEQLSPHSQAFPMGTYLTLVGMHGTMMMGMMTSGILGPFANYFVPIMIGARRMAFPRIEALTFWLLMAAGGVLTTTIFFGGFPTGWTGYAPLQTQANPGIDNYILFFALVGVSMTLLGLNMIATILTMRAPGLTWTRLPIFVWGVLSTAVLMVLAAPVLIAVLSMGTLDRTAQTSFFNPAAGGSAYLYQNLFWVFGHPEVYVLALPGFAVVLELLPVFARKPLWGYRLAVAGLLGVSLLSLVRLAAPSVRERHQRRSARVLHALDRAHLDPDRLDVPLRDDDPLARADPLHRADALLPRLVLQLPDRGAVGRLPVRYAERRDDPRQLLLDGPLPLHDHGRPHLHVLRGDLLLGAEDDGLGAERAARESPLLDDVHLLQLDLRAALRRRLPRPATPHAGLPEQPPVPQ